MCYLLLHLSLWSGWVGVPSFHFSMGLYGVGMVCYLPVYLIVVTGDVPSTYLSRLTGGVLSIHLSGWNGRWCAIFPFIYLKLGVVCHLPIYLFGVGSGVLPAYLFRSVDGVLSAHLSIWRGSGMLSSHLSIWSWVWWAIYLSTNSDWEVMWYIPIYL